MLVATEADSVSNAVLIEPSSNVVWPSIPSHIGLSVFRESQSLLLLQNRFGLSAILWRLGTVSLPHVDRFAVFAGREECFDFVVGNSDSTGVYLRRTGRV